jgi:peptidoglycan/LPS O-acetylase OafA/YrhL
MTPAFSLYLNALRAGAALLVLLSHWAYERFTGGDYSIIRTLNLGSDAVMVFFVLSGLVISHTARIKDKTAEAFIFARTTRILSVAWPAILLTLLLDSAGTTINPDAYNGWWYQGDDYGVRAAAAATFTSQIWFNNLRLGSNGPYWSLCYEVWYYILFAIAMFGGRYRWPLFGVLLLALGPRIALLFPAWLLGVAVERGLSSPLPNRTARYMAALPPIIYIALLALGAPTVLKMFTQQILAPFTIHLLGYSDEFIWNNLIAALVAIHLLGMAKLDICLPIAPAINMLAACSFTIYLVHYPLLQFLGALLPLDTPLRHAILLAGTLAGCMAVALITERQLPYLRTFLKQKRA